MAGTTQKGRDVKTGKLMPTVDVKKRPDTTTSGTMKAKDTKKPIKK